MSRSADGAGCGTPPEMSITERALSGWRTFVGAAEMAAAAPDNGEAILDMRSGLLRFYDHRGDIGVWPEEDEASPDISRWRWTVRPQSREAPTVAGVADTLEDAETDARAALERLMPAAPMGNAS